MILVDPSKFSFSFRGFRVPLLQIHLSQVFAHLSFGGKMSQNASEDLYKYMPRKKCKPKYLIYFKSYRKLHLSVVPCLCYHLFIQTASVEVFFFIFTV